MERWSLHSRNKGYIVKAILHSQHQKYPCLSYKWPIEVTWIFTYCHVMEQQADANAGRGVYEDWVRQIQNIGNNQIQKTGNCRVIKKQYIRSRTISKTLRKTGSRSDWVPSRDIQGIKLIFRKELMKLKSFYTVAVIVVCIGCRCMWLKLIWEWMCQCVSVLGIVVCGCYVSRLQCRLGCEFMVWVDLTLWNRFW